MPGRPRTMIRKVEALEEEALDLVLAVTKIMPAQYQGEVSDRDVVGQTWVSARVAALRAWQAIDTLLELLRERAGIPGDGSTANLDMQIAATKSARSSTAGAENAGATPPPSAAPGL